MEGELAELTAAQQTPGEETGAGECRIGALEAELVEIEARRAQEIEGDLVGLEGDLTTQRDSLEQAQAQREAAHQAREQADRDAASAREGLVAHERSVQEARRESAGSAPSLPPRISFCAATAGWRGAHADAPKALSEELRIEDGYELALAAALGGRLDAALVADVPGAEALLDKVGPDGGSALLGEPVAAARPRCPPARTLRCPARGACWRCSAGRRPYWSWQRGCSSMRGWSTRSRGCPRTSRGSRSRAAGRVWFAAWGEVRQLSEGGTELVLARRNERDKLIAEVERAAQAEQSREGRRRAGAQELVRGAEASRARDRGGPARGRAPPGRGDRGGAAGRVGDRAAPLGSRRGAAGRAEGGDRGRAGAPSAARPSSMPASAPGARGSGSSVCARSWRPTTLVMPRARGLLTSAIAAAAEVVQGRVAATRDRAGRRSQAGEEMAGEAAQCAAQEAEIQGALQKRGRDGDGVRGRRAKAARPGRRGGAGAAAPSPSGSGFESPARRTRPRRSSSRHG